MTELTEQERWQLRRYHMARLHGVVEDLERSVESEDIEEYLRGVAGLKFLLKNLEKWI